MKYVLVTGGAGYIGSHTVISLSEQGYYPVIIDDLRNSSTALIKGIEKIIGDNFTHISIDICDKTSLFAVFKDYSFSSVIHFAAYKSVGESCQVPLKYYQNNLIGLLNIIEACQVYKIEKLVFSSSCTVYGEPDIKEVHEETPKKTPASPYGFTKWMGEQILEDFHKNPVPFQTLCLRYFNPIGAHPSGNIGELPLGVPNNLLPYITQTANGLRDHLTVFGDDYPTYDGTCVRDYVHVCDVADAHVAALNYGSSESLSAFNIGTGKGTSVLEMVKLFSRVTNKDLPYRVGQRRTGDITEIYANVDKAFKLWNWKSKRSVEQAIQDAWHWEQQQNKPL